MTVHDELLGPSSRWRPLLDRGVVRINRDANRLVWTHDGRFAARLVPSPQLSERLTELPPSVERAREMISTLAELKDLAPTLETLEMVTTVGSLASVVGIAVSVAGFAVVLHQLRRMEGKLDLLLGKVDGLRHAVDQLGLTTESFLFARLQAAHENLDRAIAASTERARLELARGAQALFQESRLRYLNLWCHIDPWANPTVPVATARELQARFLGCAVGELQAELVLGDQGAYVHTARGVVADVRKHMAIDVRANFRRRSDALISEAGKEPVKQALAIGGELPFLGRELQLAAAGAATSLRRLEAAEHDADLPELLGRPGHEILRLMREAPGVDVFALGLLGEEAAA